MKIYAVTAAVFVLLAGGCESGGVAGFCHNLAAQPSCDASTETKCLDAIAAAKAESDVCAPFIDALAGCGASLQLTCSSSDSVAINGDGTIGGSQNFTDVGGFSVVVN